MTHGRLLLVLNRRVGTPLIWLVTVFFMVRFFLLVVRKPQRREKE